MLRIAFITLPLVQFFYLSSTCDMVQSVVERGTQFLVDLCRQLCFFELAGVSKPAIFYAPWPTCLHDAASSPVCCSPLSISLHVLRPSSQEFCLLYFSSQHLTQNGSQEERVGFCMQPPCPPAPAEHIANKIILVESR